MNTISLVQNSDQNLLKLAAQRQIYSDAKTLLAIQYFLAIFASTIALAAAISSSYKIYGVFIALTGIILDLLFFTRMSKRKRTLAAKIQESFDCELLQLPWNKALAGDLVSPEEIAEGYRGFVKAKKNLEDVKNWYPTTISTLPIEIARILCQRTNCSWDSRLRRKYSSWLFYSILLITGTTILSCLWLDISLRDYFLYILGPISPVLALLTRQIHENIEAADSLDKLRVSSESLISELRGIRSASPDLQKSSRVLQDQILENRRKNPLIFDQIYKKLKSDQESDMYFAVDEFVRIHLNKDM